MTISPFALVAILGVAAALRQAAAVEVATADEFVAAVKAGAESIEVVDHLFLNTGAAVEEVQNQGRFGTGYLITANSSLLTITGNCPSPPPAEMADGTLPANLISSNEWPYAKLPELAPNQCVLRIASGFASVAPDAELWLDNIAIQAPYLFLRNEKVAPTAADTPPATPPRGTDYLEFEPAAPGPYDIDYEAFAPYDGFLPASAPYSFDYGAPAPGPYDDSYAFAPAPGPYDFSPYDFGPLPALPPREYEGRAAYPDYDDTNNDYSFGTDIARNTALRGAVIIAGDTNFNGVPVPATAPLLTRLYLTNVLVSGGSSHVTVSSSSLFASGCGFYDADSDAISVTASTANIIDTVISSNGDNSFVGGIYVIRAGLVRAEGTSFEFNGVQEVTTPIDDRYGAWIVGPETRLYTDDPVNVYDSSRGQKLPLADAPDRPFLTGPPA